MQHSKLTFLVFSSDPMQLVIIINKMQNLITIKSRWYNMGHMTYYFVQLRTIHLVTAMYTRKYFAIA